MVLFPHRKDVSGNSATICWNLGDIISVNEGKTVQLTVKAGSVELDIDVSNGFKKNENLCAPNATVKRFVGPKQFDELSHVSAMFFERDCSNRSRRTSIYKLKLQPIGVAAETSVWLRGLRRRLHFCLVLEGVVLPLPPVGWGEEGCGDERFSKWAKLFSSAEFCDVTIVSKGGVEIPVRL